MLHIISRQIQRYLGPHLIQAHNDSVIFSYIMLDILRCICLHSGIFWQIQGYSEYWHSQTCLCILRHIQNPWLIQPYSEPLTYLDSFRHYSRAIHTYSEPCLSRFRYIQNSGLFRHVMFHVYSGVVTKLQVLRHICHIGIQAYSGSWHYRLSNVKQHLLFKSGSSFKSFGTFFHFCLKSKHSNFFFRIVFQ